MLEIKLPSASKYIYNSLCTEPKMCSQQQLRIMKCRKRPTSSSFNSCSIKVAYIFVFKNLGLCYSYLVLETLNYSKMAMKDVNSIDIF